MLAERIRASLSDKYRMLPQSFRFAVLARQRAPLWRKAGIVFVHVPKVAGTSINLALYGQWMGHARARDVQRWAPEEVKKLPRFAMTRNPWERLVSAYRFVTRGRGIGGGFQATPWRPERYHVPEFETFERFVTEWLVKSHIWVDPVFQPQSSWICDPGGNILVDHVGRLEDLEPTLDFLRQHLGIAPNIGEGNRSGERVDYKSFYTPELARLVGEVYYTDVAIFGYQF